MSFLRSKYFTGDARSYLFEEQWQVDWLVSMLLLSGFKERAHGNFMRTFCGTPDNLEACIYLQDPHANITIDVPALSLLVSDEEKLKVFIGGDKDAFFAEG